VINTAGSFALIWLLVWCGLTLLFRLAYVLIRPSLFKLHPRHGVELLLCWWSAPMVVSLTAALMLFSPIADQSLITPHCHGVCEQHAPVSNQWFLTVTGLLLTTVVIGRLLVHLLQNFIKGAEMRLKLHTLSIGRDGYRYLPADAPLVFTLGWWRPEVFISKGLLAGCNQKQLAVILDHEKAHENRKDNLRLLLGQIFALLIPAPWRKQILSDLHVLCEQACDFDAADKHDAISVAQTLVHVGRLLCNSVCPVSSMSFDGGDLTVRVNALLEKNRRYKLGVWQRLLMIIVVCSALILLLDPLHHSAEHLIAWFDTGGVIFYRAGR